MNSRRAAICRLFSFSNPTEVLDILALKWIASNQSIISFHGFRVDGVGFRRCMGTFNRRISSLIMVTAYLLFVLSPLAPLAMQSKLICHAVTGECSGDCKVDGCSLERIATHTCCCWQKKLHDGHESDPQREDKHCKTVQEHSVPVATEVKSCCASKGSLSSSRNEKNITASNNNPQKPKSPTISTSPCGSGKSLVLLQSESTHHLPHSFIAITSVPRIVKLTFMSPERLTSRYGEPPDPPPIIS
jgi:hypothetical protein